MARGSFSFNLTGLKETMDALEQLPTVSMQKGAIRNALKAAGQPIAEAAREGAPYDPRVTKGFEKSKHLRDTISVSTSLKASQRRGRFDKSVVTVYVGSSSPHAHLVEFGTTERTLDEPRTVNIGGNVVTITTTGRMSPNPFLRTAWDMNKEKAVEILGRELWEQIAKAARRLAKKAQKGTLTAGQARGLLK